MQLHWKIIIGLVLGAIYGILSAVNGWNGFTSDFISPFGTIFLNLLKLIAVPLVVSSLITGVASLSDTRKLSRIGWKTIALYISTTAVAVSIGLILVNLLEPGMLSQKAIKKAYQVNTLILRQINKKLQHQFNKIEVLFNHWLIWFLVIFFLLHPITEICFK